MQADYFFGKPVADGEVQLDLGAEEAGFRALEKQSLRTDKDGKARFEFVLPVVLKELAGREQNSGDARIRIEASVTDSAGQKQVRSVSRLVTTSPLKVEIIPEAGAFVMGVLNSVYVFVSYADGRPARAQVELEDVGKAQTSALGVASFDVVPHTVGLTLRCTATDAAGLEGKRSLQVGGGGISLPGFLVRIDKAVYNGGDSMKLVALGGGGEPVFIDLVKDGQTVLTETVDMQNGRGEHQIDLPPELFGTLELCAYRISPLGQATRLTRIVYVRPPRQLDIQATLDAAKYRPGGKAKLRLTLTDSTGQPTPGALSLAAVDEAVFAVLEQAPGMERTFYLLEQELLKPVYAIYPWAPDLKTSVRPEERQQFEQALFARTVEVGMNAGPTQRQVSRLEMSSFPAKAAAVELNRSTGYRLIALLVVMFLGGLGVAGYIGLWLLADSEVMIALHAVFVPMFIMFLAMLMLFLMGCSSNVMVTGAKRKAYESAPQTEAPLQPPPGVPQPVLGVGPVNQSKTLERPAEGAPAPPRVREFFPETLLWRPELITDDQGRASLDIDLADSITTWRLTISAVSADGRLGAAQPSIRVFQPFFVDLNLPVSLTRGDEVAVPAVVYNYLAKPQAVELRLERAEWFEALGDLAQRLELGPNEVRSVSFRIRAAKVGEHDLQVSARGSGVADALKRQIEVVPDGRRIEETINGNLQSPASFTLMVPPEAIDGSAKAILKIYPSTFSQLVEGLDGIFQMPYGCFEQTSSTTYPNVLALDYLRRTKKSAPEVEAKARQYIHLGAQRLLGFEVPGGGFDWFGRSPANLTLTAYGLMEFADMAKVHDVDPALIARTRQWLLGKRNADGTWSPESHAMHDDPTRGRGGDLAKLSTTAYVAWAVWSGKQSDPQAQMTRRYLLSHQPQAIDDPYVLALVCNALLALNAQDPEVRPYLVRLDGMKMMPAHGKTVSWHPKEGARTMFYGGGQSGAVEATALATLAFLSAGDEPATVRAALAWLIQTRGAHGTWGSTQATVLALKALVAATGTSLGGDQERRIEVRLGDQLKQEIVIPADQAEVMKQLDLSKYLTNAVQTLTIVERSNTGAGFQLHYRYHLPGAGPQPKAEPLTIDLSYDRADLAVGDTLKATATVTNRMPQAAPMVILDLPVPAGFAVEGADFAKLVEAGAIAKFQVTARQVIVYLRGLEPGKPLKLEYRLHATMPVKVSVPPARVYEYYDPAKQGRGAAARLTVQARQ